MQSGASFANDRLVLILLNIPSAFQPMLDVHTSCWAGEDQYCHQPSLQVGANRGVDLAQASPLNREYSPVPRHRENHLIIDAKTAINPGDKSLKIHGSENDSAQGIVVGALLHHQHPLNNNGPLDDLTGSGGI
jgi:hypothetical protein